MTSAGEAPLSGVKRGALALLIGAALGVVYWPALRGAWLWDDGLEIAKNSTVHARQGWWLAWTRPEGMDYFPLKGTVQWLEWHLWGEATLGYHVASVGLHFAAALLLWRLLSMLGFRHGWVGAALFALHPAAVESVAWIAEQKNALSLVLALIAACAYLDAGETRKGKPYALALGFFVAALLCKSTVVMLPVVFLLLAWWRRGSIDRADLKSAAPFFAASLVLGVVTVVFQHERAIGLSGAMPSLAERLEQGGWNLLLYPWTAIVPLNLAPVYAPVADSLPSFLPWLVVLGVFGWFWSKRSGWGRAALFAMGAYYALLLPTLGFAAMSYLRIAPRADHLGYLGLVVVAAVGAAMFGRLISASSPARRMVGAAVLGCVLVSYGVIGRSYAGAFADSARLWSTAVERNPDAWLAQNNLGQIYLQAGNAKAAAEALDVAERLQPASAEVRLNRGSAYERLGDNDVARLEYAKAIALDPSFAGAYYNLGLLLFRAGDLPGAVADFQEALKRDPGYLSARNNLGVALGRMGRPLEATEAFKEVLRMDPSNPEAHLNLANGLVRQGQLEQAIAQYRAALAGDPNYAPAHINLSRVLRSLGREAEARAEEIEALKSQGHP